jgi:hypothetical protein
MMQFCGVKIISHLKIVIMKNIIENHNKAAMHCEEAAKLHLDAAKSHSDGNHEKAHDSTIKACGHTSHVVDAQNDISKQHCVK